MFAQLHVGPLTFSLYGVILAVALVVGWWLAQYWAQKLDLAQHGVSRQLLDEAVVFCALAGLLGARLWHVMTDWHLYAMQPIHALYIWNGGLSILGAVIFGVIALWAFLSWHQVSVAGRAAIFDLLVLVLPFSQMIGRWGNFFNQELYGLATDLPWAISVLHKDNQTGEWLWLRVHPLFAYEIAWILLFVVVLKTQILFWGKNMRLIGFGSGKLFLQYMLWYCLGRFGLGFLRWDRGPVIALPSMWGAVNLGFNQVIMIICIVVILLWAFIDLLRRKSKLKHEIIIKSRTRFSRKLLVLFCFLVPLAGCANNESANVWSVWQGSDLDHTRQSVQIVVVANGPTTNNPTTQNASGLQHKSKSADQGNLAHLESLAYQDKLKMGAEAVQPSTLVVELVNTNSSITKGLSGRSSIGADGMLFVLDKPRQPHFWMKDMQFDLDLVWLDTHGQIVGIDARAPAPKLESDLALPTYRPQYDVQAVLEINAGNAAAWQLKVGQKILPILVK